MLTTSSFVLPTVILTFSPPSSAYEWVNQAWKGLWQSLDAQVRAAHLGVLDQLTIVVDERNAASDVVAQLCERAVSSIDRSEFVARLNDDQQTALASIKLIVGELDGVFELLRRTRLLHLPQSGIEMEMGRRRLAGAHNAQPKLLPILRDLVGGASRRRGLFLSAPLRRRLKLDFNLLLGEPPEWGLATYRTAVRRLARLQVPGTTVAGPAEEFFVWPRARRLDSSRHSDFEDENLSSLFGHDEEPGLDLRVFPSDQFDRVVVVAGPGHGKSALLTAIAGQLTEGVLIPVAIPLASLASANTGVIQFLQTTMSYELELSADWTRLAEQGLLVLLLDGLDEVPATSRPALMRRIANFSVRYPNAPWMLTVRDAAVLSGLPQASLIELLPLNDTDVERFAQAMKSYVGNMTPWEVVHRIKLYPDIDQLARIPLFLMMLLAMTDLKDPKPMKRADLIETYLTTLFSPERLKTTGSFDDRGTTLRAIAETLAFERLERQEIGATEREVKEVVSRFILDSVETDALFERLYNNGILKRQSAVRLQFPYPIVQEYLAARHLVERYPESLNLRILDAIQRPWAQVIQFALELVPNAEPVIEAMLAREDDAFATGLRLIGRCIANGARVSESLRLRVGERLVDYWIHAPSDSRERVGRVLADGFANIMSAKLQAALHHRWLIDSGAGEILNRRKDTTLTLSVLDGLIMKGRTRFPTYPSFKDAMCAAGDAALRKIIEAMDPETANGEAIINTSWFLRNLTTESISTELVLEAARDDRLPREARLRAYKLAGPPLSDAGATLVLDALHQHDSDRNYPAIDVISIHSDPSAFLESLLRTSSISIKCRRQLAAGIGIHVVDPTTRKELANRLISDTSIEQEIRNVLRLIEARYGNAATFRKLIHDIPILPTGDAAITIALFGHYPERELAEQAAALTRSRATIPEEVLQFSASVTMGLRGVFEMDASFRTPFKTCDTEL